jgi:hypothetical protein
MVNIDCKILMTKNTSDSMNTDNIKIPAVMRNGKINRVRTIARFLNDSGILWGFISSNGRIESFEPKEITDFVRRKYKAHYQKLNETFPRWQSEMSKVVSIYCRNGDELFKYWGKDPHGKYRTLSSHEVFNVTNPNFYPHHET